MNKKGDLVHRGLRAGKKNNPPPGSSRRGHKTTGKQASALSRFF
jgi:hypothetical protein